MNIQEALAWGTARLLAAGATGRKRDAQVLLGHVLQVERATLYTYPERLLTAEQEGGYRLLIERRASGEPVAYLVGHQEFYGYDFLVDSRVLIPRPETELLVEAALEAVRVRLVAGYMPIVADIGTGSGIIPITLALEEPRLATLYAVDISAAALEVARLNSQRHGVEQRLRFLQGDLLAPLPEPVTVVTANLPYVGTDEMELLAPDVREFEPHLALFSGPEGLDLLRRIVEEARDGGKLRHGAVMLLEIGYQQGESLQRLFDDVWPQAHVTFAQDFAGWNRLLKVDV